MIFRQVCYNFTPEFCGGQQKICGGIAKFPDWKQGFLRVDFLCFECNKDFASLKPAKSARSLMSAFVSAKKKPGILKAVTGLVALGLIMTLHLQAVRDVPLLNAAAFGITLIVVILVRRWRYIPATTLFFLQATGVLIFPAFLRNFPVIPLLLPLMIAILVTAPIRECLPVFREFRRGNPDAVTQFLVILTGFLSTSALLLWASWTSNPGIGAQMVQGFAGFSPWLLYFIGVPLFALINATVEEAVFRGLLQPALRTVFPGIWLALVLQASVFAAFHFATGFPNGLAGYAMVLAYGVMLGYLKERSGGMLAPVAAHIIADLTIGYYLVVQYI